MCWILKASLTYHTNLAERRWLISLSLWLLISVRIQRVWWRWRQWLWITWWLKMIICWMTQTISTTVATSFLIQEFLKITFSRQLFVRPFPIQSQVSNLEYFISYFLLFWFITRLNCLSWRCNCWFIFLVILLFKCNSEWWGHYFTILWHLYISTDRCSLTILGSQLR